MDCPVCHSTEWSILGSIGYVLFDDDTLENEYAAASCIRCGFVKNYTPSTQREYDRFYKESFYSTAYVDRALTENEQKYFHQTTDFLSDIVQQRDQAIFDIGCGVGYLLETLKEDGYTNLFGVDPSSACVSIVSEKKSIPCREGAISDLPFLSQHADLIILSHII